MPAVTKAMVMPVPMVPAPITATDSTLRRGVSRETLGILLAARSAKKRWRSALDCSEATSSSKSSRSRFMPASKLSSQAA